MGTIYAANDRELRRKVAIKVLDEHLARDPAVRRRFTREARAAARLSGQTHAITIFDVGEWNARPFIVMEYLGGGTLAQRLRAEKPSRPEMLSWLEQAAEALDCAHREGIVHRDVKPANLMFDRRGDLHVVDFGIARVADETTGVTMAGTVLGTAGYLSPEQARGEPATTASDVYSLAVVAYELLTGGRPFERGSATAEATAHVNEPIPPASERAVGLPQEVDAVFERALAKDASRRYRTATDFVRALGAALQPALEPTRVAPIAAAARADRPAPTRAAARRSHALPLLLATLLAGLALAGVVAAAFLAGDDGDRAMTTAKPRAAAPKPRAAAPRKVTVTQQLTVTDQGKVVTETVVATVEPPPAAAPPPPAATQPASQISLQEARALTDQATGLMRQGNYDDALPIALKALDRLEGTGDTYEGYANYDVGKSLAMLGRCEEALPYLERREQLLGPHPEVTAAKRRCGA